MGRRVAPEAEVAGRGDQPLAEVPEPDPVDQHPRRSADCRDRRWPGPARAGRSLSGTACDPGREHLEELPGHGLAGPARVAPDEDVRIDRLGASFITIARGGEPGCVAFELVDLAVELRRADPRCV